MREYSNSQIRAIIEEYIHNARHRTILVDRYVDGLTYEQIAERHDMSVRGVKTIVYRHEGTIFKHLET